MRASALSPCLSSHDVVRSQRNPLLGDVGVLGSAAPPHALNGGSERREELTPLALGRARLEHGDRVTHAHTDVGS